MWKKKPKISATISMNDIAARLREFILDSQIQNGHELSVILGCPKISDEIAEREEEESEIRVAKISHLIPLLYAQAHALAEGAIEFQRSNVAEELKNMPDEIWWESRKMMEQVSMSAIMGAISQMIDMGMLDVPKKKRKRK
jgi:hypothetical protein